MWHRAVALAGATYTATSSFPQAEQFGISGQMRRSAVSVASNIAEGCGRESARDFARFLRMAYGSACELETQAVIAASVNLGDASELARLIAAADEMQRMLNALMQRLRSIEPSP